MNQKVGKCKLCLSTSELRDSHFIPKSAYKLIQQSEGAPPIAAGSTLAIQTNQQLKDYVLCSACEDRFSKNGEAWVMRYCARNVDGFRLKELIDAADALGGNGLKVYSAAEIPEINVEQLSYFAASIIWRAAVHDWRFGTQKVKRLYLGPYTEELRKYLLGEQGFPEHAVIWVSVIPEPKLWGTFAEPYGARLNQCWRYKFPFLGICFMFFLGRMIDPLTRSMCTLRSEKRPIYTGEPATEMVINDLGRVIRKSRPAGSLKKRLEDDR